MQWYTSKEMSSHRAFDGFGAVVARESVRFSDRYMKKYSENNFATAANESINKTFACVRPTWLPEYNEIGDRVGIALQEILVGDKQAKEALDEVNEEIYLIMKLGGYYKDGMKNPCRP
jgi:ABC-type glycerol-3-phosphate transport system substrate-binding protein